MDVRLKECQEIVSVTFGASCLTVAWTQGKFSIPGLYLDPDYAQ